MKRINIEENVENLIIDLITKSSEDRLIAFKPQEATKSVDLVVKKRGEYNLPATIKKTKGSSKIGRTFQNLPKNKSRELSFQINIFIGPSKTNIISKDFLKESFITSKDFYLMFIYFDEVKQDVSNIWLIPSFAFLEIAEKKELKDNKIILRFETTVYLKNEDKYAKFLINKEELGNFLLEIIMNK